jgi:hypothetical protein
VPAGLSAAALQATTPHPAEAMKAVSVMSPMSLIFKQSYGVASQLWLNLVDLGASLT